MSLKFTDLKHDGYERVLLAEERVTGFYSIIAIHNTKRGPALGGCRFFGYHGEDDQKKDVSSIENISENQEIIAWLKEKGFKE